MPPKSKKTKAEEAADFLSTLDLDVPDDSAAPTAGAAPAPSAAAAAAAPAGGSRPGTPSHATRASTDGDVGGRASIDSKRSVGGGSGGGGGGGTSGAQGRASPATAAAAAAGDEEAQRTLAFLEAQINTKRAPLSVPGPGSLRTASPLSGSPVIGSGSGSGAGVGAGRVPSASGEPANVPSATSASKDAAPAPAGWGGWWSSASNAIQSAQKIADEGYRKVRTEGVAGLEGVKVGGVDLGSLRKGAEERLKGMQIQGIDLDKLRHDLVHNTQSALSTLINTVAPPISAHETLELWLAHPMVGYAGVEGVVYRAWTRVLEQTESGELVVVWSPPAAAAGLEERGLYPADGWTAGWELASKEVREVRKREGAEPLGRANDSPEVPVTTVPIFLYIQPLLAPLAIPEPPLLLESTAEDPSKPKDDEKGTSGSATKKHLHFIVTLHDPSHSLQFSTTTQATPADWLEVEYERSDWVEERLVDVLRTGVEVLAQDYVATRMGLKTKSAPGEGEGAQGEVVPVPAGAPVAGEAEGKPKNA